MDGKDHITVHPSRNFTRACAVLAQSSAGSVVLRSNLRFQVAPLDERNAVTYESRSSLGRPPQRRSGAMKGLLWRRCRAKTGGRPRLDPDPGRVLFSDRRSARLLCAKSKPTPEVKTRCAACFTFPRRKTCRIVIGFRAVDSLRNPGIKHGLHSQNSPSQRASPQSDIRLRRYADSLDLFPTLM